MGTRSQLLLLLRKHPGTTVAKLAADLGVSGMAVRRHLDALAASGQVEADHPSRGAGRGAGKVAGRPPAGWKLTEAGLEQFPRRYDDLALDLLADLSDHNGDGGVDAVFTRQAQRLADDYRSRLDGVDELGERVTALAAVRDESGYLADAVADGDGAFLLTESNCAVHRVAQHYPAVCAMELEVLQQVLGPDVEVSRVSHTMSGDAVCAYRIGPCCQAAPASTPAAAE